MSVVTKGAVREKRRRMWGLLRDRRERKRRRRNLVARNLLRKRSLTSHLSWIYLRYKSVITDSEELLISENM